MSKTLEMMERDNKVVANALKLRFFPLSIAKAKGSMVYDEDGNEYLDFNAGWGVANIGYGDERVINAVNEQMNQLTSNCLISSSNARCVELAEKLIDLVPGNFEKKVWFGHSGSDANEFISKVVPMATGKPRILSFIGSYHGQTMGSYGMSGHPSQGQIITLGNVVKVPYPYCYRCPFGKEAGSCDLFCAKYIEDYILKMAYDPNQIGAMIFESIMSDGGDVVPPDGFLKEMERIARKHGIWVVADEVKIGLGRTGKLFGFQNFDITPDAVVIGKPLAGGLPLSAVVGRKELMDVGYGIHMFTTAGDPTSCAAALATLNIVQDDHLTENARDIGAYLIDEFKKLQKKYDCIGDVRGKGLIMGIEFVKNRATKEPDSDTAAMVVYQSFTKGLMYYYAGTLENVLELTPPLVLKKEEAEKAVRIIDESIDDVLNGRVSKDVLKEFTGWG